MDSRVSFKFADEDLNRRLIALLKKRQVRYAIDEAGQIMYSADDEELVENDLIGSIRNRVFSNWQVLSCPRDWVDRYRKYMRTHQIPFREELIDGEVSFLLPRKYRPHRWKLGNEPAVAGNRIVART